VSGLFEEPPPSLRDVWNRRKLLRKINSEFGPLERLLAADLSYTAFWYYIAYLAAGIEPAEARRLARRSELLGEDATNYE